MKKMLLKTFFLFFVITIVNGYDKIFECFPTTPFYNLENNTISLFQTPNFPNSIANSAECNAVFTTNSASINIWIGMINGATQQIQFFDNQYPFNNLTAYNYISAFDTVTFSTYGNSLVVKANATDYAPTWTAFQAIIITYPAKTDSPDCPLGSQTFDFSSNPDLVIPVTPTFKLPSNALAYKRCNWFFKVGQNQQLKIFVKKINLADNITLILQDETMTTNVYSFANKDAGHAYYFDKKQFNFTYQFNHANISDSGFLLLASAVNNSNTFTSNKCKPPKVNTTAQTTIFTNIDYANGYPPYQKCNSTVTVPANHEARFYIDEFDFEGGTADTLILNYGNSQTEMITLKPDRKRPIFYKLTPDISNSQLVFTSDGNTQGAGYTAFLEAYECKCADSTFVIQCGNSSDLLPLKGTYLPGYCSNMDCNYTIVANSSCPNSYFSLNVLNSLRESIDYLVIADNGLLAENITAASGNFHRYYSSKNNLSITFHSGPSTSPITTEDKSWYIFVTTIVTPVFVTINLNETNTKYVQWLAEMGENDALTVCAATGTLEMFVSYTNNLYSLSYFLLYDGKDLSNFVGSLSDSAPSVDQKYPKNRNSLTGCFTIYVPNDSSFYKGYSALFRIADDSYKNCANTDNVYQVSSDSINQPDFDASITSTQSGSCEMIILSSVGYSSGLPHVWISNISATENQNYSVYSTVNNKKLFEFSGSEASQWQYVGVYTPALSIVAPPGATVAVRLSQTYQTLEWISIVTNGTQKGIMASPSYSGFRYSFALQSFYTSNGYSNFSTTFNVKEVYGNAKPMLDNAGSNKTLSQGSYNADGSFVLFYEETDGKNNGFLIEYTILSAPTNPKHTNSAMPKMFEISLIIFSVLFFV